MLGVRLGPLRVVVRPVQGSHPLMGSRGQLMCERRLIRRVAPTAPLPTRTECVVARRDRTLAAWHTLRGGGSGVHPDLSDAHQHPAYAVPDCLPGFTPSASLELAPVERGHRATGLRAAAGHRLRRLV